MKHVFLFLLVSFAALPALAEQQLPLRDHMRAMGYLMDEIYSRAKEPITYKEAAQKTRELRGHLVESIALIPTKLITMREQARNSDLIEYHQLMARVIYLSATLEHTLSAGDDFHAQSATRQDDVRNLLHEINVLVGKAHRQFRD
ncbi:MAG: hypothetical protein AB7G93_21525 [Bdellovibrionales bacterium]